MQDTNNISNIKSKSIHVKNKMHSNLHTHTYLPTRTRTYHMHSI